MNDDVEDLQAHLDEYEADLRQVIGNYDGVIDTYEAKKEVDSEELLKFWEDAKMHYAIELNYIPIYAKIWQGIYGIKEGIDAGKPVEEVRGEQDTLEETLWQALGAVKMAALFQANAKQAGGAPPVEEQAVGPVETLAIVKDQVDRVMAKCAERDYEAAMEMVHDTYLNRFEGVEGALIEQDADLVVDLEKDFNVTLPKLIEAQASIDEVKQATAAMQAKLDKAVELLKQAEESKGDVFGD